MNENTNASTSRAKACVIWMHGLGADSSDMAGLAQELSLRDSLIEHVYLSAPVRAVTINNGMSMPAWYDIVGVSLTDREDSEGIKASQTQILQAINEQIKAGFSASQIFLAGFSQGGAMALYVALHLKERLGGVISLSAYLPLMTHCQPTLSKDTPFFLASGRFDPIVLPAWSALSADWIKKQGYQAVTLHEYPMEHAVCHEEMRDLSIWLLQQYEGIAK